MVYVKTVKIQAAARYLASTTDLAIFDYGGQVQYERDFAHKSWALGNHSSLGDYMFEIQH
jgi:hypothetical protein